MEEKEITALAREYAEEIIKGKPSEELPNCLKNSMLTMNTEYIAEVFQWLLRRFYLVEKSEVERIYSLNKRRLQATHGLTSASVVGLLESLFPEIAKEV